MRYDSVFNTGCLMYDSQKTTAQNLLDFCGGATFTTILADPPWRSKQRQGKLSPEYASCNRYPTMPLDEIKALPVKQISTKNAHLYLWIPVSMLEDGLAVLNARGFKYKSSIAWEKIRRDGATSGECYGHYFRNSMEILLFGVRGSLDTVRPPGGQCNVIRAETREHSRKPDAFVEMVERLSPGPHLELFARGTRPGWSDFGNQAEDYKITWPTQAKTGDVETP